MSDKPANIKPNDQGAMVPRAGGEPSIGAVVRDRRDKAHQTFDPPKQLSTSHEMHDIARKEFARRRRGLGVLTVDQELCIETLLISTVDKISKLVAATGNPGV